MGKSVHSLCNQNLSLIYVLCLNSHFFVLYSVILGFNNDQKIIHYCAFNCIALFPVNLATGK